VVRPFIRLSKVLRRSLLAENTYSFPVNGRRINPNGSKSVESGLRKCQIRWRRRVSAIEFSSCAVDGW
jgi:hypothetical protein